MADLFAFSGFFGYTPSNAYYYTSGFTLTEASVTGTNLVVATGIPSADGTRTVYIDYAWPNAASIPQLANFLTNDYWLWSGYDGTGPRHWASNSISVNVSALTAPEQALATAALAQWASVAPLTFTFTSGPADITYVDSGTGSIAATTDTTPVSGQNLQAVTVDISQTWFSSDGGAQDGRTGFNSYDFQTYLSQTGHALGLGNQGIYNGSATYGAGIAAGDTNIFANDTWQYSVMSAFPQSNYGGSSNDYVVSPQMADIYAIQSIYGAAAIRAGDTIYGFHSNAGAIYDFASYTSTGTPAFTIYDTGGTNTLDASCYSMRQLIDLNYGAFSSIGGFVNNIGIDSTTRSRTRSAVLAMI